MPRLDNSTQETVARFGDLDKHNWDDPGDNDPFDFCLECWEAEVLGDFNDLEIDHPDYDELSHLCLLCGIELTNNDNDGHNYLAH